LAEILPASSTNNKLCRDVFFLPGNICLHEIFKQKTELSSGFADGRIKLSIFSISLLVLVHVCQQLFVG
jgi:hypothetical protein